MSTPLHVRRHDSVLAAAERRLLVWIAERLPSRVHSDHLSALGLVSMAGAGLGFWYGRAHPIAGIALVIVSLALNWFGDSLDGTVARVRNRQRPRYGFYVDHVIDLAGTALLFAGLALSGFMSPLMAVLVVAAYFLVCAETYLATHARGTFAMAFLGVGPTELRIILAAGALRLLDGPFVTPFGLGEVRLFDLGGAIAAAGMTLAFLVTASRNARALYLEETHW
jgi:phosphatidylglycerophosphate synthase